MMKHKRLSVSIAAIAACFAFANVASATTLNLTSTEQTFLAPGTPYTVLFTYNPASPTDLIYNEYYGAVNPTDFIATYTVPISGFGSYLVPAVFGPHVSLTYGLTPSVPETATWAMMLIGMGAIGFAARRRPNVNLTYA